MSTYPPPFIVYAMPRSRSFWLSRFLTYGGWQCGHEEARHVRSLDDVRSWLAQPFTGTVETAAAPFWRLQQKLRPDARVVVLRRDPADACESLMATRVPYERALLADRLKRLDTKLGQIATRMPDAITIWADDLGSEAGCARVFEHCLPVAHDPEWWARMAALNLQTDLHAMHRYFVAHGRQAQVAAGAAKQECLALIGARPVRSDAFTFQQEPLDRVLEDGRDLMAEHAAAVGETLDGALGAKNFDLVRRLETAGALVVTTARQNGRLFGYLMAVLSPSLENTHETIAQNAFCCTAVSAPGLGLKLQRASVQALRERGVDEIIMRAGVRGSGPRMGVLYCRLGAKELGMTYRLRLKELT